MHQFLYWNGGGCVPADTLMFKSVEVRIEGLERREILPWGL